MNEQTKKLGDCESEIGELTTRIECIKKQLEEKERKLIQKDKELLELQSSMISKDSNIVEEETTEILVLKVYISYCFRQGGPRKSFLVFEFVLRPPFLSKKIA